MLESVEYEMHLMKLQSQWTRGYYEDMIAEKVAIHAIKKLDKKLFGFTGEDSEKVHVSANLCNNIRKYPDNNAPILHVNVGNMKYQQHNQSNITRL